VAEVVPASRKLSKDDAAKLAREASQVIVAKGRKLEEFEGGEASAEVVAAMLGPTGNLRAPCIRAGKTLLVGFNEEAYERVFG
jgi:arsenate reductase-like glutaredoxin family protein